MEDKVGRGERVDESVAYSRLRDAIKKVPGADGQIEGLLLQGSRSEEGRVPGAKYRRGVGSSDMDLTLVVADSVPDQQQDELRVALAEKLRGSQIDIDVIGRSEARERLRFGEASPVDLKVLNNLK